MMPDDLSQTDRPVGAGPCKVADGDCLESIAVKHGHYWQTIWNDAGNRELQRIRQEPNLLRPGDRLTIPPIRSDFAAATTEARHRFRRKGVPSRLQVRLQDENGEPITNEPCQIEVDGAWLERTTDDQGIVKVPILPNARHALIVMPESNQAFAITLGHVDPIDTIRGVQGRLQNLGYDLAGEYGAFGDASREAIGMFQSDCGLEITGEADQTTRRKLEQVHGS